jgi:CDP-diacylglycerol--serine O-phosphatidyltransferase
MIKKQIPNFITSLNLVCGCLAIVCTFHKNFELTAFFIVLAAVLDFFDGFAARMLKVNSEIGKQLDSLADMVTFGVVPGFVMYQLIIFTIGNGEAYIETNDKIWYLAYVAMLIPVFSAYRLAKFNIDTRQSDSFIGIPTPANALFICFLPMLMFQENGGMLVTFLLKPYVLIMICFIQSYLMIAELPLIALKFKTFSFKSNEWRYTLIIVAAILLLILKLKAVPLIVILYVILSMMQNMNRKQKSLPH